MWTRPNLSSGVPLYRQLAEQVKHGLEMGVLRPGETLPAVSRLAAELVVNPNSIARAYQALAREGVIDLRSDAGVLRARARRADPGFRVPHDAVTIDREFQAARDVQQRLMPQAYPLIQGIQYAGACRPALAIGGDYFDFIPLSDGELAIAIGDVCGKGVPAALLMATLRAFLHGQTRQPAGAPAAVVSTLNQLACGSFSTNRFATFFYAHLELATRTLRYVNAGHPPALVCGRRGGAIRRLTVGGPAVGLFADGVYREGRVVLDPGDVFVAFTDGISEAANESGGEWGEVGIARLLQEQRTRPAGELIDRLFAGADAFAGGCAQHDDMTLVALRMAAEEQDAVPA